MENPSFSHPVYNVLGLSGTVLLFAIIVAYARLSDRNEATVKPLAESLSEVSASSAQASTPVVLEVAEVATGEAPPAIDPQVIAQGKGFYDAYCAACHGLAGKKRSPLLVGSNVFDDESVYGTDDATIRRLIEDGIIEEGMVPWKSLLTAEQIDSLVTYIASEREIGDTAVGNS